MANKRNEVFVDFPICFALLSSTLRLVNAIHATRTLLARREPPSYRPRMGSRKTAEEQNAVEENAMTKALVRFGGTRSSRCVAVIPLNDGNTDRA